MSGKSLAFTERDRAVVREVARFGVMSRHQLMRLKFFSSKTRANDRLKRLVDEGYLVKAEDNSMEPTEKFFAAIARYKKDPAPAKPFDDVK